MVIVILAAGTASRMGRQKLLLPIDGRPIVERVIAAAAHWPFVIVAGDEVAIALKPAELPIVRNPSPERGMAYSLKLANAVVPDAEPIAVVLADCPDIITADISAAVSVYRDGIDVVMPRGAQATHPVLFGPQARRKIAALADGDTIKQLRDDPALRRRYYVAAPQFDIDTPDDYRRRTGMLPV